ncbi:MAG: bifunctional (p)ppGpp synthetase/guanosine-3',5'-bis(diphosphate) 3'-pyrophosphohydrolase [Clostridiales bacterium]|nr:bifunctional (p)ppGpp synthetase/guanosine-3',5'-bis(diphosphate) 3'-pyrophosphohydrolase [Clostridiales bacterium]
MEQNLLIKIKKSFSLDHGQKIIEVLNMLKCINIQNSVYNIDFAVGLANDIIDNKLDYRSVITALYYPIIKNDMLDNTDLGGLDDETYSMIIALSNLEKLNLSTKQEQLESIKNMFIAIAKDIRVIIIKLCIEQQKLNFIDLFTEEDVEKTMRGYNDIFAPIAAMLGISHIKNRLEDATFRYYKPTFYNELKQALSEYVDERNDKIQEVIEKIKQEIAPIVEKCQVYGRQKQLYSIAKKLQKKNMGVNAILDVYGRKNNIEEMAKDKAFNEITLSHIMDILAVRVIVSTIDECYAVLGKIFSIFKPFGNFKDYIANPKANGYQSLHTAIILDNGDPVEIQIRTFDMHNYAEYGFAAHWAYKINKKVTETDAKINYIRSIMEMYKDKSDDELMETLKTDVYLGKIFVQSPQGKILELPEGSTPIDFAYAIHSKIGDSCVGAKINGKMFPLATMLSNGDVVEIITNPNSKGPSRDWLKVCKTQGARTKIRAFFKREMKEENIKKGKSILESQAKLKGFNLTKLLVDKYLEEVYDRYTFSNIDDMYASIGYGGITANQVLNKLQALYRLDNPVEHSDTPGVQGVYKNTKGGDDQVVVRGYSNLMTKLAKCCNPIPGDKIVGYVSRGNGVTIHREDCSTIDQYEFERLIECDWKNTSNNKAFVGNISVIANATSSTYSIISKKVTDNKLEIVSMNIRPLKESRSIISLGVKVASKHQLDDLINKIKILPEVIDAFREN